MEHELRGYVSKQWQATWEQPLAGGNIEAPMLVSIVTLTRAS